MRALPRIAISALIGLTACSQVPPEQLAVDNGAGSLETVYHIGDSAFAFSSGEVLQTWPVIAYQTPMHFARVALQMPATTLDPDLQEGRIQIDVLPPQRRSADDIIAAAFPDWRGREAAADGSRYQYDPKSKLQPDGGRRTYLRGQEAHLVALTPEVADDHAPTFFLSENEGRVDQVIECRRDLPPSHDVGEYCALYRVITKANGIDAYGYRIFFPRSYLDHWQKIDTATRFLLARAFIAGSLSL